MQLKQSAWEKAKTITSFFEGWISGNFDGQGLSYGYLQWNFGQGTLQPLFMRLFNEFPKVSDAILPEGGKWLREAIEDGYVMEWAAEIQDGGYKIHEPWLSALYNLYNTPEWQQIMDDAAVEYRDYAINMCNGFGLTTDRAFCLMFDIAVQNGPINPYELAEPTYQSKLEAVADAAVRKTNPLWQSDVGSRKLAIVYGCDQGRGWPDEVTFNDEPAFEEETQEQSLAEMSLDDALSIIGGKVEFDRSYWQENAIPGGQCDGEYVSKLIIKIAKGISV